MARTRNIVFVLLFGSALLLTMLGFALYVGVVLLSEGDLTFGESIAVVDIDGEIFYSREKVAEIEEHRDNDDVKAMLVFINSPGGGVTASQALYHAILSVREKKPVVAFMGAVAASGGYYVASAADSILAHEGTLTGSIGVIATFLHTEGLYEKIGLDVTVIKSGRYKDVGSPHRKMTQEERLYLGDLLDSAYSQFLRAISTGRGMPLEEVEELAEGRLYSGEQAFEVGLVDRLATYEEAIALAASMGGIVGEPSVIKKRKKRSILDRILGQSVPNLRLRAEERIRLEYIIP